MPYGWMSYIQKLPNIIYFILRFIIHSLILCWLMLLYIKTPQVLIVQNPPSIPVLSFLWLFKQIRRKCKVIIDVHNYGYTLMYKTKNKKMLAFCKWYEKFFVRKAADHALTVSETMKGDIMRNWGVKQATVCYDKANSEVFRPFSLQERHQFFTEYEEFKGKSDPFTIFTKQTADQTGSAKFEYLENRPILLLTSTTYTEDEKLDYLFTAMVEYEKFCVSAEGQKSSPRRLILVITGKGERKAAFQEFVQENRPKWKYISVEMIWFKPDDYPKMVACADVGVCLHYSSSGTDLPMKVVDMFGTGLPALAANYQTIPELVQEGQTGKLFTTEEDLVRAIRQIGSNWESFEKEWLAMRENVMRFREKTFSMEWKEKVLPLVRAKGGKSDGEKRPLLEKEKGN